LNRAAAGGTGGQERRAYHGKAVKEKSAFYLPDQGIAAMDTYGTGDPETREGENLPVKGMEG